MGVTKPQGPHTTPTHLFEALEEGEDILPTRTGSGGRGGLLVPECHHGEQKAEHGGNGIDPQLHMYK